MFANASTHVESKHKMTTKFPLSWRPSPPPPPSQPNQIKVCIGIPLHQNLPHSCFRKLGGAVLHLSSGVGLAETALQSGRRSGGWYARSDTRSAFPVERQTIDGGCFHQSAIDLPALG